ncbi:hypothetical protein PIB30_000580, partial [Stylosanthes scabra]|nr:hypothetical protein [Stylosanthes scabra]
MDRAGSGTIGEHRSGRKEMSLACCRGAAENRSSSKMMADCNRGSRLPRRRCYTRELRMTNGMVLVEQRTMMARRIGGWQRLKIGPKEEGCDDRNHGRCGSVRERQI